MDVEGMKYLGMGLTAFGMLGAAIGVGNIFSALVSGIARNPAAEKSLKGAAILGMAFAEVMGLMAFALAMIIKS